MPPVQKRFQLVGLSRQSAKGTLAASTQYALPTLGGGVLAADIDQEADELTSLSRISQADIRKAAKFGASFETRGFLPSLGLLLYAALGNISSSGASDYTHTITPGDLPLYLSLFGRLGTDYSNVRDCMIDELKIKWVKAEPISVSVVLMGTVPIFGTSWTGTVDESVNEDKLSGVGGTFKLDVDSATAVEAQVVGGEITIKNNIQPVELSKGLTPDDVFPGRQDITIELDLLPVDLAEFRGAVTGASGGTAVQATPVNGSFDELFTLGATKQLQLAATKVPFLVDYPEGSAEGGAVEVKVVGGVRKPAGTAFTATVKNQTATYPAV